MKEVCLVVLISLAGCTRPSKTPLLIYSPHGKEMLEEFEKEFEAANPDVDVQWLDMGSQDAYDRIRTEKSNPQADVWWGSPSTIFMRAEKESLLTPYRPSWANSVASEFRSPADAWYGTFVTPEVIVFNSRLLTKDEAPKEWDDLLDPKWKGRTVFSAMIALSVARTGSEESGFDWLRRLDANTKSYTSDPTQMYLKLAREEAAVSIWDMPDIVLQARVNGYPFGYNFPKGGTVLVTDGIAIVRGCRHPELARKFYEFVTTEESLILQANKFYRIPARNDIPKSKLPDWITSASITSMRVDWELIAQRESTWMKKWDEEIKGRGRQ
jgi:iron(III) transport system substrate-binding protein